MESVLRLAGASDIVDEPFPHLVIHDALTAEWYDQLEAALVAGVAQERRLVRRVGELNEERRDHFLTTWFYRLLLVVVGAGAVVAN